MVYKFDLLLPNSFFRPMCCGKPTTKPVVNNPTPKPDRYKKVAQKVAQADKPNEKKSTLWERFKNLIGEVLYKLGKSVPYQKSLPY